MVRTLLEAVDSQQTVFYGGLACCVVVAPVQASVFALCDVAAADTQHKRIVF
jgi:hypothetical protein